MKGSNGQNPHTTREKLPTNRKRPHLIFAVLSFESYCTLICKHKKTNSIQTFIQSIKDVAHHHIVKESKEKADNDDSESKAPDDNDKWEKGRCFWSWHITTLPKGPSDQMSWSDQRLRTDQDPSEANLVILNFFSVLKETW